MSLFQFSEQTKSYQESVKKHKADAAETFRGSGTITSNGSSVAIFISSICPKEGKAKNKVGKSLSCPKKEHLVFVLLTCSSAGMKGEYLMCMWVWEKCRYYIRTEGRSSCCSRRNWSFNKNSTCCHAQAELTVDSSVCGEEQYFHSKKCSHFCATL